VSESRSETDLACRVLIVDDDPSVREILRVILQHDGWIVETAGDGADAMRRIGESEYAVILLDLMMPRVDGAAVIDFIKSRGITTPVVVVSAVSERVRLDPQIVRVTLQKPFEIRDLRDVLRALLDAAQASAIDG
jgi:two-component system, OmpR family, response regulator MprA